MSDGYSLIDQAWMSQAMPTQPRNKRLKSKKTKKSKKHAPSSDASGDHPGPANIFMSSLAPYEPIYANEDDAFESPENEDNDGHSVERVPESCCPPPVVCPPVVCPPVVVCPDPKPPADERYDTFLYVFSGVLLLFVLEQFLQLGIAIGARPALIVDSFAAR